MALPSFTHQEQAGLRFTPGKGKRFLFIGVGSALTANTITDVPRGANIPTLLGQGPLAEALSLVNSTPGLHGPHYAISPTIGVAAAWGSITKVGGHSGPTITFTASVPYDRYDWVWQTLTTGILGAGEGRYSLDGGKSWSSKLTIPSGGTYAMPNTNTTLTFPAGTYTAGEEYTGSSTEPYFSTANLGTAITAALTVTAKKWDTIVLLGAPADGAAGAAMYTALDTQIAALANVQQRYVSGIMDLGIDAYADIITEMAGLTSTYILPVFGTVRCATAKPFTGFLRPRMSGATVVAARACEALISESLGRVARGPLRGVTETDYDEYVMGGLNDERICTFRTFPGNDPQGVFVSYDHIRGPVGTDPFISPMRGIANRAAEIVRSIMTLELLDNYPTTETGTIEPVFAGELEGRLNTPLRSELIGGKAANGKTGHVSDIYSRIDIENDFVTEKTTNVTTLVRDTTRVEHVLHTLSFTSGSVTGESTDEPAEEPEE